MKDNPTANEIQIAEKCEASYFLSNNFSRDAV